MNNFLPLPIKFDMNEWLVTGVSIVLIALFILLPKRFPSRVTIFILMFNSYLGRYVDTLLFFYPLDLYDVMDTAGKDLFDVILYTFVYPFYGYLICYVYDRWKLKGWSQAIHIILWAAVSVLFEGIAVKAHIFVYKGWQLIYSLPAYMMVYSLNILFLYILLRYHWKRKKDYPVN
ncbi:hypothetical protein [Gordoniibacillus kamchatkensis]|uniref:hypothetical protein n=1 Tax=Gordoniibacillus kamchatkensis TaxID=1590651 RepID=UPI0006985AC1|nr:hypothetical protein [Paenibacillus sp. VKM B-2647]